MRAPRFIHQHKFDLAADALLLSSGLFAITCSLTLLVVWLLGGFLPESGPGTTDTISDTPLAMGLGFLTMLAGTVVGPALAWWLHGRTFRWRLLLALPLAVAVMSVLAMVMPLLATVFELVLSPVTDWEFAGPVATLAVVTVLYGVVMVHAMRDAMAPAGDPPMLERMRLLSLVFLAVLALVVAGAAAMGYYEIGEALIFAMAMGFAAAAVTGLADVVDRRLGTVAQPKG